MKTVKHTFTLENSEIDRFTALLLECLQQAQMERSNTVRIRLAMESLLLRWQEHFGPQQALTVTMRSQFGGHILQLSLPGELFDPTVRAQDDNDWETRLLQDIGLSPRFSHRGGVNHVILKLRARRSHPLLGILISVASAIALGLAGLWLMPVPAAQLAESLLAPVRDTLLGLLSAVSVPMIFLSVLQGVCSAGDSAYFGRMGNRLIFHILVKMLLFTALTSLVIIPLFTLDISQTQLSTTQFSGALDMILNILPANLVEPFITGNTLQLIVIALAIGVTLLAMGPRTTRIQGLVTELHTVVSTLLEWVTRLIPAIIFFLLLETVWSGNLERFASIWQPLLVSAGAILLVTAAEFVRVCLRLRVPLTAGLRRILPAATVALAASSAVAAFSINADSCRSNWGVSDRLTRLGVPLATVAYKPTVPLMYLTVLLFGAQQYLVECSPIWFAVAVLTCCLLAIATPTVPGGCMACFAVLFAQMGVPGEAVVVALAMDPIVDRLCAMGNVVLIQLELASLADRLQLQDKDILHERKAHGKS